MTGRILRLSLLAAILVLAGCGGKRTMTVTQTVSPGLIRAPVRIYFARDGKVAPVSRRLPISREDLLRGLAAGPTAPEQRLGLARGRLAETVYTLSQFDPGAPVTVEGKRYTRASFEDATPAILVETPLPFETVHGPELQARGTANTFEATFEYDLVAGGKVVAHHFVTATSGSGTRGTFSFAVPIAQTGPARLIVYESSAEDGRRIHVVEIPLLLAA